MRGSSLLLKIYHLKHENKVCYIFARSVVLKGGQAPFNFTLPSYPGDMYVFLNNTKFTGM